MLTTLLTLAVLNAAGTDASLSGTEFHRQGLLVAQADLPPPPPPLTSSGGHGTYDGWTIEQLQNESRRLNDMKPSIVGPIVLLAVGAGLAVFFGIPFTYAGVGVLAAGYGVGLLVFGLALLLPGIAMAVIGGIWLGARLSERSKYSEQIDEVENRIQHMSEVVPGSYGVPLVEQFRPAPRQMILARF